MIWFDENFNLHTHELRPHKRAALSGGRGVGNAFQGRFLQTLAEHSGVNLPKAVIDPELEPRRICFQTPASNSLLTYVLFDQKWHVGMWGHLHLGAISCYPEHISLCAAHPWVSVPAVSTPSQSQGRPEDTEEMGPLGWLGGSVWDVSEFSAQPPYVLSKLWLPITCAGRKPERHLIGGSPHCHSYPVPVEKVRNVGTDSPSSAHMGLRSGYEVTAGMFWDSRALHPAVGVTATELRGLVGWPCHSAIRSPDTGPTSPCS